ncbi:hypothetical protein PAXRUDRAFT_18177 [Paxillus rubicundulus Ve08.2h10]|uniref:Unplaced genomic scaffold scaffold_2640, whole genome shotgun sequence n=1 Tax=Paxillus rubicundulus Ve08.2h10 TaxID=930991 RepID=A0A0D0D848_9AGAM|nr:hypothetical protein PAXRUDRAFT_18177 [Paxillus rubicundulus Ve08.2h10]
MDLFASPPMRPHPISTNPHPFPPTQPQTPLFLPDLDEGVEMSPPPFTAPRNIETVAIHASLPAHLLKQPRPTPSQGILAIDPLASPPTRGNPGSSAIPAHAININFSLPPRPVHFREPPDFAPVALLDCASEPVASSSHSTTQSAQLPLSSATQPDDPWALYLKVQSLIQTVVGSWNISAGETDAHQSELFSSFASLY